MKSGSTKLKKQRKRTRRNRMYQSSIPNTFFDKDEPQDDDAEVFDVDEAQAETALKFRPKTKSLG